MTVRYLEENVSNHIEIEQSCAASTSPANSSLRMRWLSTPKPH